MLRKTQQFVGGIILMLVVFFTNQFIPVCYLAGLQGPRKCEVSLALVQMVVFAITVAVILVFVRNTFGRKVYQSAWMKNWLIIILICLALLSNLWSVVLAMTLLRSVLLLMLALIASYFGMLFSARDLVNFTAISIGVLAIASLLLGILVPEIAIMSNHPYEGLWRGVFWHKVYLGAVMALGYAAFLTVLLAQVNSYTHTQKFLAGGAMLICIFLAIKSDSATGLVIFAIQTGLIALLFLWLKWGHAINRETYMAIGAIMVVALVLAALNIDFIFRVFNRSPSMTGRVPLWLHLLKTYISDRPVLGYGIGTFWYQPGVSARIQSVVGWGYPIGVSDNGYMDILLGLGVFGLVVFLSMLATGLFRTFRYGFREHDIIAFFPALVIVHIVFVNLSLSYFLESESFVWFLLVLVLFMSTDRTSKQLEGNALPEI
jgi:exopolysaccharide production protein ExoQ